jgi:hypothetical protein
MPNRAPSQALTFDTLKASHGILWRQRQQQFSACPREPQLLRVRIAQIVSETETGFTP